MPSASEAVAARLRAGPVRVTGAGTRAGWGPPAETADALSTEGLDQIVDHEPGDFTAVVQAGVRLRDAQSAFARAGQTLMLDPPGDGTIGGLIATADSGPLRHRYGAPRDLVIGVALALSDGTVARGGGRVIKNVAGYDLPKLAAGSYGTLGVITEVAVRLHPLPDRTATAVLRHDDPDALQRRVLELVRMPLEAEALDVRWDAGAGQVLVRFAGAAATDRAARIADEIVEADDGIWEEQRALQRGDVVVRVHHLPTDLARVLRAAPRAVGRAAVGTTWVQGADVEVLRRELHPNPCVLLDGPEELRARVDPFAIPDGPERALMRSVKARFDPPRHCNPGLEP